MPRKYNFGYECEYFLEDPAGNISTQVPARYPRDGTGLLVEVRSNWFADPDRTLESFHKKYDELVKIVERDGCHLAHLDSYEWLPDVAPPPMRNPETAGFHVHFSKLSRERFDQLEIDEMMAMLDAWLPTRPPGIPPEPFRLKPHGWEYRRLPASVDLDVLTKVLKKGFC